MARVVRVIVTRPARQAAQWVNVFNAQGFDAQSFPLIEIDHALQPPQRQALQADAAQADVCMWVSANAVSYFYQENTMFSDVDINKYAIKNIVFKAAQRHWATGPGTVAALLEHGVTLQQIDAPDVQSAQWDTETLWRRVAGQMVPGKRVLILRGQDIGTPSASRDWLADQIRAAGGQVQLAAVYQRRAPRFSAAQTAWAQAAAVDGSVWVFSSSQALTHLPRWPSEGGDWHQARCIATHERIAQAARTAGFGVVCTSRPSALDVAQSIKSLA